MTSWSLSSAFVPEQPLYFLVGKGALDMDMDKKQDMFTYLLEAAIDENGSPIPTDKWAIGTADLGYSSPYWAAGELGRKTNRDGKESKGYRVDVEDDEQEQQHSPQIVECDVGR